MWRLIVGVGGDRFDLERLELSKLAIAIWRALPSALPD